MAHQRNQSAGDGLKSPHTVSLKVLRLSRPSLAHQHPLPQSSTCIDPEIPYKASFSHASQDLNGEFAITPLLNLPEAFGTVYVGETFACTLCANNELVGADEDRRVHSIKLSADMQTPSTPRGIPVDLTADDENATPSLKDTGRSIQKILQFELKEEGSHVLAITVTYTETTISDEGSSASERVRTFRKLYQFVAQQLLSVRTKAGILHSKDGRYRYALEAQLENLGEVAVCLESIIINPKPPFKSTSLNWDAHPHTAPRLNAILGPRDVAQVAFLLEQEPGTHEPTEPGVSAPPTERRTVLGQLSIRWRGALGDQGSLSTGWLTSRR